MSTHRTPPTDAQIAASTLISARLGGCTCTPDIKLHRDGNIVHTFIAHDSWCAHTSQRKGADA